MERVIFLSVLSPMIVVAGHGARAPSMATRACASRARDGAGAT